jgi:hypothetical protein
MVALAGVVLAAVLAATAGATGEVDEGPPRWTFRHDDRPVKVVLLAGSIGAWRRQPYHEEIERRCPKAEVVNLSKTGLGAWALKQRFKEQVLDNRKLDLDAPGTEHWMMYGGGLNSMWDPAKNNHHVKTLFVLAHMAGMKVVGLTVTPWGDDDDRRFAGTRGLDTFGKTMRIVDFIMGRSTPKQALGPHAARRPAGVDGPWDPLEVADVAVDLFDSPLRDKSTEPRDLAAQREALQRDRQWARDHRDLDEKARAAALDADARTLADLPRWYMREELRSFDHIHPNQEGHRLMAAQICPALPASWGCRCAGRAKATGGGLPEADAPRYPTLEWLE